MARRSRTRDLAGLAALGALGYMAMRGDKQAPAPVEDRSRYVDRAGDAVTSSFATGEPDYSAEMAEYRRRMAPAADQSMGDTGDFLSRRLRVNPETGEAYSTDNLSPMRAARAAAFPGGVSARSPINDREQVFDAPMTPRRDPNISAEVARRTGVSLDSRAGAGRGIQGGPTAEEIEAYRRSRMSATSRPLSREEMISQIPMGGTGTVEGGDRVSGNEMTRNVGNILTGLGPTRLAGFSNAAIEGATAKGAAQRAAALRAERTEAARRGQTPTTFKSTRPSDSAKRVKKFNEEEAGVEFKRGGKIKAKPKKMASGGMSSASKRADGIASKGKTKCKMY